MANIGSGLISDGDERVEDQNIAVMKCQNRCRRKRLVYAYDRVEVDRHHNQ